MARGSGTTGYRGGIGRTRTERVPCTLSDGRIAPIEIYRCVNVATHPEIGARLKDDTPGSLNAVELDGGARAPIAASVVYHDPNAEVFVLVIDAAARHTELAERAALYAQLADESEYELPRYVREFDVVFGADELSAYLERRADQDLRAAREAELERELAQREARIEERERELEARRAELERVVAELESAPPAAAATDPQIELEPPVRDPEGTPLPQPIPHEQIETNPVELLSARELQQLERKGFDPTRVPKPSAKIADSPPMYDEPEPETDAAVESSAARSDSASDDATRVGGTHDVTIERWIASRDPTLATVTEGHVRLAATVGDSARERLLADELPVRVQLHRMPTYPLVTIALGKRPEPFCFLFDIGNTGDRAVLSALGKEFELALHVFDTEYLPIGNRDVRAELSDNVRYVLTAADEHLRSIPRAKQSYARAEIAWSDPDYDRHGLSTPERALYRDELFDRLDTPAQVREAVQMAAHFSQPELEELLILKWGEPLARWNKRRGKAVLRAVEVGLWPGADLAQLAVSAGAARSRKDLVQKLERAFARTVSGPDNDLDADAIEANRNALREQEGGRPPTSGPIRSSEGDPDGPQVVSGTIGEAPAPRRARSTQPELPPDMPVTDLDAAQLVALLSDKDRRREAAIELCRRAEPLGLGPIFASLGAMTRAEAVQVLGFVVQYGEAATPHLLQGLEARKGFVRQGCALALAVQKSEAAIEAVCDLLVSEPTEIWREVARAVGELGPGAVMSLVSRLRDTPEARRERIAWALAHIAARGGVAPVDTLAQGRDPTAAGVARHALELADLARTDNASVRGPTAPRDQTVNRAFSRKFFEALDRVERATKEDSVVVPLDDADLIEEDVEPLDDSDLIPSA